MKHDTLILVTGGSGYVASHVVARLLRDGRRVRTTVRSLDRAADLHTTLALPAPLRPDPHATPTSVRTSGLPEHAAPTSVRASGLPEHAGRLEIVVADLASDDGWDAAMAGCTYVLHVASPFPARQPDHDDELIIPARDGTLRVLRAARDGGVRRVVMTSSFAAVGYSRTPDGGAYDETDWTDPADDNTPYVRSKTIAERAAWDFVATEGEGLELAVINPSGIFGPVLGPGLSASAGIVKAMLEGAMPAVAPTYFAVVDVRDVAGLHLRAMTHPAAAGERFLAGGETISFLRMAQILSENLGDRAARVPTRELSAEQVRTDPALREAAARLGQVPVLDTGKARAVLGWEPRDASTTIVDTAKSLFRLGLV